MALAFTNLIFMDDVILFGQGTLDDWIFFWSIFDIFTTTSAMTVSIDKSSFLMNNLSDTLVNDIKVLFPFKTEPFEVGFKYLGYRVKPMNYLVKDWKWLVKKFKNIVSN